MKSLLFPDRVAWPLYYTARCTVFCVCLCVVCACTCMCTPAIHMLLTLCGWQVWQLQLHIIILTHDRQYVVICLSIVNLIPSPQSPRREGVWEWDLSNIHTLITKNNYLHLWQKEMCKGEILWWILLLWLRIPGNSRSRVSTLAALCLVHTLPALFVGSFQYFPMRL